MHILFVFFAALFVLGFLRGLLGGRVTLIDPNAVTPAPRRRDPLSPTELHLFHQIHGTPGW